MKKAIAITVAVLAFLSSLALNIYYAFDGDDQTEPNVTEVVEKGKDIYKAATAESTTAQTQTPAE